MKVITGEARNGRKYVVNIKHIVYLRDVLDAVTNKPMEETTCVGTSDGGEIFLAYPMHTVKHMIVEAGEL